MIETNKPKLETLWRARRSFEKFDLFLTEGEAGFLVVYGDV
jgi:hypothetical protein